MFLKPLMMRLCCQPQVIAHLACLIAWADAEDDLEQLYMKVAGTKDSHIKHTEKADTLPSGDLICLSDGCLMVVCQSLLRQFEATCLLRTAGIAKQLLIGAITVSSARWILENLALSLFLLADHTGPQSFIGHERQLVWGKHNSLSWSTFQWRLHLVILS